MCIMESFNGFLQFHYIVYLYCETTFVKLEEPSLAHQWLLCSECGIHNADRLCQQESVTLMYVEVGVSVFQLYFYIEVCSILYLYRSSEVVRYRREYTIHTSSVP